MRVCLLPIILNMFHFIYAYTQPVAAATSAPVQVATIFVAAAVKSQYSNKPRTPISMADKLKAAQAYAKKCPCCAKTVYKAEELFANGSSWHPMCFTCGGRGDQGCKRRLNATNFQSRTGEPYCKACFNRFANTMVRKQ